MGPWAGDAHGLMCVTIRIVANGLGITAIGIDRLIQEPYNILMLDEPTNHLDAGQRGVETGVDPI
jgi:hypothetical protein